MEKDRMVIHKDISRFLICGCGLIEGVDENNPEFIWVRWAGDSETHKERIEELIEV